MPVFKKKFGPGNDNDISEELEISWRIQSRIVHLDFRAFKELPAELLDHAEKIEELYLRWNQLNSIPDWIGQFKKLVALYLSGNYLKKLPESVGFFENLLILDIQCNNLKELPKTIGHMRNLEILKVQENKLEILPQEIIQLKRLLHLNARGNLLRQLPSKINEMRSLEELILDENNLTTLPQDIVYLPKLKHLSLNKNELMYMPFDKFINAPDIFLKKNQHLNYLPYSFGRQIDLKGCSKLNVDVEQIRHYRVVGVPECKKILVLPKRLRNVILDEGKVPSLLELALRKTYRTYFETSLKKCLRPDIIEELPSHIQEILYEGPVGKCEVCARPIFDDGIFAVFPEEIFSNGISGTILASMLLCSTPCFKTMKTYLNCKRPAHPKFVPCKLLK